MSINLSLRTRPQPGVAIPELYRSVMGRFPLKTGGFPRQCDHWLGMTPLFRQPDIMEIMLQGIENRIRIEFVESDVPNTKMICCFRFRDDTKEAKLMTDKELHRLSRKELLEMLLAQTQENEKLKEELRRAQRQLSDRRLLQENAGSMAEAAMRLNAVFEAADRAAQQYLENVRLSAEERTGTK